MKCQHCGAEGVEGAAFCHACGASFDDATTAWEPEPSPGKSAFNAAVANRRSKEDDPEDPLWEGSYSKLAMTGLWVTAGAVTLAVLIIGLAAKFESRTWGLALTGVAVLWIALLARLIYMQLSVHYTLTTQRLVHERGLLWRRQDRIETIDIDDVSVQQGPVERMLGVGTVRLTSSDRSTPEFTLSGIEGVRGVATMIDEARRNERRKRGVHIEAV